MDKIGGYLKYNLDTKKLPKTSQCFILQVTVTDTSTGAKSIQGNLNISGGTVNIGTTGTFSVRLGNNSAATATATGHR